MTYRVLEMTWEHGQITRKWWWPPEDTDVSSIEEAADVVYEEIENGFYKSRDLAGIIKLELYKDIENGKMLKGATTISMNYESPEASEVSEVAVTVSCWLGNLEKSLNDCAVDDSEHDIVMLTSSPENFRVLIPGKPLVSLRDAGDSHPFKVGQRMEIYRKINYDQLYVLNNSCNIVQCRIFYEDTRYNKKEIVREIDFGEYVWMNWTDKNMVLTVKPK